MTACFSGSPDIQRDKGGRPRLDVDADAAKAMRRNGASWTQIAEAMGVSRSTAQRLAAGVPKPNAGPK